MLSDAMNRTLPGAEGRDAASAEKSREMAEKQENAVNQMLSQVLEQAALVRLSNLAAAKPEKAKMVETTIINMAKRGQIAGRLSDDGLKALLEKFSEQAQHTPTVKFDRRRVGLDSDDEDF